MSLDQRTLPEDPRALCRTLYEHCARERLRLVVRRTMWLLAWYYLAGARRFDRFHPETGVIVPSYLDQESNMEFQSQELLTAINRNAGRISSMDLRPRVVRGDQSLAGIRDRACAQVILDSLVANDQLEKIKTEFAFLFTALGSCGVTGHIVDHETVGLTGDLEVVHPQELYPFPSLGTDYTKGTGLVRERVVSLNFLEEKFGKTFISKQLADIEWWRAPYGTAVEGQAQGNLAVSMSKYKDRLGRSGNPQSMKREDEVGSSVALIRELWLGGPRDTCTRYVCSSGEALLHDERLENKEVYCPIGFSRFYENGTFHGSGVFDILFGISREAERLLKSLFQNIRDTDRYGFVVMPSGSWNERAGLREIGHGLRVLPWEPDPISEGFRPFVVQPFNLGDVPGKVAAFANEQMDRVNPWRDLLREKGRVDSMAGLQFLDEQVNRAITNPSRGVQKAFGQMYRGMAAQSRVNLLTSAQPLPVTRLTLDLAGVKIDPQTNTVSFSDNPLPNLSRLAFGVLESNPRSVIAQKTELIELYKLGQIPWDRFVMTAIDRDIEFSLWIEDYSSAYEACVRNCLLLYGDGETPGEIILTPHTVRPEFQLMLLDAFMQNPRMAMASPAVQDEFKKYQALLLESGKGTLPEGVPNPEDAAALTQQAAIQQMTQGMGPPGGPPPGPGSAPPVPQGAPSPQ